MKSKKILLMLALLPSMLIAGAFERKSFSDKFHDRVFAIRDWYAYNLKGKGQKRAVIKGLLGKVVGNTLNYVVYKRPLEEIIENKPAAFLVGVMRAIAFPGPHGVSTVNTLELGQKIKLNQKVVNTLGLNQKSD